MSKVLYFGKDYKEYMDKLETIKVHLIKNANAYRMNMDNPHVDSDSNTVRKIIDLFYEGINHKENGGSKP